MEYKKFDLSKYIFFHSYVTFTGDSLYSFSFAPGPAKGSLKIRSNESKRSILTPFKNQDQSCNSSTSLSDDDDGFWLYNNYVDRGPNEISFPPSLIHNPNLGIVTLDSEGTILTFNKMATTLLSRTENELSVGKVDFLEMLDGLPMKEDLSRIPRGIYSEDFTIGDSPNSSCRPAAVVYSGHIVNMDEKCKNVFSLWLGEADHDRWIAVMEPIISHQCVLEIMRSSGKIMEHDSEFSNLFGKPGKCLIGEDISNLLPSFKLPTEFHSSNDVSLNFQDIYGKIGNSYFFPLSASVLESGDRVIKVRLSVYKYMSGLVIIDQNTGNIVDYNYNFIKHMFGYNQGELLGKKISLILPEFANVSKIVKNSNSLISSTDSVLTKHFTPTKNANRNTSVSEDKSINVGMNISKLSDKLFTPNTDGKKENDNINQFTPVKGISPKNLIKPITSTPSGPENCNSINEKIAEGVFNSLGKHKDGAMLELMYQTRWIKEDKLWAVWIMHNSDILMNESFMTISTQTSAMNNSLSHSYSSKKSQDLLNRQSNSLSLIKSDYSSDEEDQTSSFTTNTDGTSGDEYIPSQFKKNKVKKQSLLSKEEQEARLAAGTFGDNYTVLRQIGKGAYGCVKMSYRNDDGYLVVTKFIRKSRVPADSWVDDLQYSGRRIPLEISLLSGLDHPNIVKILDFHENNDYFQLVMQKWGAGMDLFEFIDRHPQLDEPLASYIFRQICDALEYLNSRGVLHRDVKDENVVIDHKFRAKLIDFGSAAFVTPDTRFTVFAGTVEYCSPEVLRGNIYRGHELEIWSLGVTLFTLMYAENPFYDMNEILRAEVHFPFSLSSDFHHLVKGMLLKDPNSRLTLKDVSSHPWTRQPCIIKNYRFEEVVRCTIDEAKPRKYISDYSDSESIPSSNNLSSDSRKTSHHLSYNSENSKNSSFYFSRSDMSLNKSGSPLFHSRRPQTGHFKSLSCGETGYTPERFAMYTGCVCDGSDGCSVVASPHPLNSDVLSNATSRTSTTTSVTSTVTVDSESFSLVLQQSGESVYTEDSSSDSTDVSSDSSDTADESCTTCSSCSNCSCSDDESSSDGESSENDDTLAVNFAAKMSLAEEDDSRSSRTEETEESITTGDVSLTETDSCYAGSYDSSPTDGTNEITSHNLDGPNRLDSEEATSTILSSKCDSVEDLERLEPLPMEEEPIVSENQEMDTHDSTKGLEPDLNSKNAQNKKKSAVGSNKLFSSCPNDSENQSENTSCPQSNFKGPGFFGDEDKIINKPKKQPLKSIENLCNPVVPSKSVEETGKLKKENSDCDNNFESTTAS